MARPSTVQRALRRTFGLDRLRRAGRAGRDGEPAACVLLYDPKDRRTQIFFMGGKYPSLEEVRAVIVALRATL